MDYTLLGESPAPLVGTVDTRNPTRIETTAGAIILI
jgi:hypothetical protein